MGALIVRLSDDTLERLSDLAEALEVDVNTVIGRLLDRDPHDHPHRCPTCVKQASREADGSAHEGQGLLFEPVG